MGNRLSRLHGLPLVAGYGALAVMPLLLFTDPYRLGVANLVLIYILLSLSFDVVFGHAGQISLGHIGFMAIGAYTTAIGTTQYGWPSPAAMAVGVAVAAILALVVGRLTTRLYSHYLALATIGVSEIIRITAINADGLTNGTGGLTGIPALPGATLASSATVGNYLVSTVLVAGALGLAHRFASTAAGRRLAAVSTSETAAASLGISPAVEKTRALIVSAAGAALAGSVYAHTVGFVSPDAFGFSPMFLLLAIGVIGGKRHPLGLVLVAGVLVSLPELLREFGLYWQLAFGAGLLVAVLLLPNGVGPLLTAGRRRVDIGTEDRPAGGPTGDFPAYLKASIDHDTPALQLQGLSKSFGGVQALRDATIRLAPGQVHALIGPNGAGKTTLINVCSGVWKPDGGSVHVGGRNVTGVAPHLVARAGLARTFQNIQLFDASSVLDNVLVSAENSHAPQPKVPRADAPTRTEPERAGPDRAWAEQCLRAVGLEQHRHEPAASLPYGTQRLLEIARCLAARPHVLLLDEPAAGLNDLERHAMAALLESLVDDGLAILLVEHDMPFVMGLADTVTVLDFGQVIATGDPTAVQQMPAVVDAYLGTSVQEARP